MRKLSNIVLYIIIAITIIVMGMFYFGGGTDQAINDSTDAGIFYVPNYTTLAIDFAGILLALAIIIALAVAIWGFIQAPKQSMKSLLGIGLVAVVLIVSYFLSDIKPIKLQGSDTFFTDALRLRLADVCIWSTWILLGCTLIAIAFAYFKKLTK